MANSNSPRLGEVPSESDAGLVEIKCYNENCEEMRIQYSDAYRKEYTLPDIEEKWMCHVCNEKLSYNNVFILMHFREHQPSTQEGAPQLSTTSKDIFGGKTKALEDISHKSGLLNYPASPAPKKDEEAGEKKNKEPPSNPNKVSAVRASSNSSHVLPLRTVAKKSCSGRLFINKKIQERKASELGQSRTVAKKSCSSVRYNQKPRPILTDAEKPTSSSKLYTDKAAGKPPVPSGSKTKVSFEKTSAKSNIPSYFKASHKRHLSPERKEPKKKESHSTDRNSKHEPPSKKAKANLQPMKKKNAKKQPKKNFPKPPLVPSSPRLTNVMLDSMANVVKVLGEPSPCIDTLKKYMDISFPYRKYRYESMVSIHDMLTTFPALRNWEMLKYEFERFKRASFEELNYKLKNELETKYEIANANLYSTKYTNSLMQKVLDKSNGEFTNDELARDAKLLCYCCGLTGGRLEGTLYKQRQPDEAPFKSVTPTIDICGELGEKDVIIGVYCEESLITETPNFYEAVLCTYSIYWIFNLCYEKTAKPFYEELDFLIGE